MQTADIAHQTTPQPASATAADTTPPPDTPTQVALTGTFREVNWITRTAQLYDNHGHMTPVRFTPDQDNWLRLVANVPVNLKGTYPDTPADASQNGAPQPAFLHLTEVKVPERQWFPYDVQAFNQIRQGSPYNPDSHKPFATDAEADEFMQLIRTPDHVGSGR